MWFKETASRLFPSSCIDGSAYNSLDSLIEDKLDQHVKTVDQNTSLRDTPLMRLFMSLTALDDDWNFHLITFSDDFPKVLILVLLQL
jgi:hypothetical protein